MDHPLTALQDRIFHANKKQGFWDVPAWAHNDVGHAIPQPKPEYILLKKAEKIALIHSEVSEALEGVRKPGPDAHCPEFTSEEVELADALIRILDYAGGFNIRLSEAMEAKLLYNAQRPFKHGKKF